MKPNAEIVREALDQVVNRKTIDAWDQYFSPDYVARGAPFIGMGFSRDTSGNKHIISAITPGSPAEGKLRIGDELLWVEDARRRWETYEDISKGLQIYHGSQLRLGVRRGQETVEAELTRGLTRGFDTDNVQAKADMLEFMTHEIPDLSVDIKLILADGDKVCCLMEYRGTHATFKREAIWREIWIVRLSEGKIVESWPLPDVDAYLRQLGYQLVPPSQ
ncbi:MAG: ester cyclase [Candidatus Bipolaricaulota bacterium]